MRSGTWVRFPSADLVWSAVATVNGEWKELMDTININLSNVDDDLMQEAVGGKPGRKREQVVQQAARRIEEGKADMKAVEVVLILMTSGN